MLTPSLRRTCAATQPSGPAQGHHAAEANYQGMGPMERQGQLQTAEAEVQALE